MDAFDFITKLNAIPFEVLCPHLGKHVAWSSDAKIIASADNLEKLYEELDRLGATDYIVDYLPDDRTEGSPGESSTPRRPRSSP